jgi:TolB-like protein/Flp pilus assembly protein TadD
MKRCPECRRDYYDDTLLYCLDDGNALLEGPAKMGADEPATAILHETAPPGEAATRAQIHTTAAAEPPGLGGATERRSHSANRTAKPMIALAAVVVVLIGGFFGYRYFNSGAGSGSIDSIAVLPFQNVSGDANLEYLSDGIAESLINSLTQLQQLKVIARNTAFRYKGKDVDAEQIGRDLSVRAVLTGRVRQAGDKLNIQVDLVDAVTGAQLWGEEYERPVTDALSIKQAIAREVTEKLRIRISGEQEQQLVKRETSNADAYQSYLRGRYYWNRRSVDGIRKAITEFQQAVDSDPSYALGHVGLADCYLLMEEYAGTPATDTLPKAQAAVDRALQIDPSLAEAHASKGLLYTFQWRWPEAEGEFKKAIELNPKYPTSRHWYSIYLRARGRHVEGLREMKTARELDPLAPNISQNLAMMYWLNDEAESAIREWQKVIELEPNFAPAYGNLGLAYVKRRRYEEALAMCQRAVEVSGRTSIYLSQLGYAYAVADKRPEAIQILKEMEERYAGGESVGQYLARVHIGLGDKDQAFAWLEKDFKNRSGLLPTITWWQYYDDLRSDPRYADLVRRMGLAQ